MSEVQNTPSAGFLVAEEFNQLHEHLREHERAISTLTIVMITASVTLLSAVGIFYLRFYSLDMRAPALAFSYLFLAPAAIVIPLMAAIRGHRESLYKMGMYIKVFMDGPETGSRWGTRLEQYRQHKGGESQDSVPYFAWAIAAISYIFFIFSIGELASVHSAHYFVPASVLLPLLSVQHYRHRRIKSFDEIERIWRAIRDDEETKQAA